MPRTFDIKAVLAPISSIVQKLKSRRDYLAAELQMVDDQISRLSGRPSRRGPRPAEGSNGATPAKRKRQRRTREDLEAIAQKIIEFIGSKGKEGASGAEIKAAFGNLLPSVNAWLKNYSKTKFKTTGSKSKTRYVV